MKIYADEPVRRTRQMLGDVLLAIWVLVWVRVGVEVRDTTLALAVPGRRIARAGGGLADRLRDAGGAVSGVPVVGDEVRAPFDGAGRAADQIARAGSAQVHAVTHLAFWLGLAVVAVPVVLALALYLPPRWRFARGATAARRLLDATDDLGLFALRALAHRPLPRLAAVSDDPAGAWRAGDQGVIAELASLELSAMGLSGRAARRSSVDQGARLR